MQITLNPKNWVIEIVNLSDSFEAAQAADEAPEKPKPPMVMAGENRNESIERQVCIIQAVNLAGTRSDLIKTLDDLYVLIDHFKVLVSA